MRRSASSGCCRSRTAISPRLWPAAARSCSFPKFWLNEATNVLWVQVRRKLLTADEAREGLALLRTQVEPTPTAELGLHDVALEIGLAIGHSTYDTLYVAFALAVGATNVVVADRPFVRAMSRHPKAALAGMLLRLGYWAKARGIT